MRVVAFGTYDVEAHPRVAVLLEGLRCSGAEVVAVNAPLGLRTADRVAILQQPWRLPLLAVALARSWARLLRRSARTAAPDAVLVGYMGHFDVLLARTRWPRTTVVLDHLVSGAGTARDRGESGGVKQALLRRLDATALGRADVVVVDTDESAANLPARFRDRSVVVPVGATAPWFDAARPAGDVGRGPLRVVFVGLFTPLQGALTIARAVSRVEPGLLAVTMVGTGQDHGRVREVLAGRDDVTWHDWVPGERLPALVAAHDVALGIFGTTPKALTVVPTKVYQGAAAGCAVVTSGTGPQRRALDGAAVLVPPGDDAELADVLTALARDPGEVARLRAAATARAEAFAPAGAVAPLAARLGLPAEGAGRPHPTD